MVPLGEFHKVAEKSLTSGFWLVFATVSAVGGPAPLPSGATLGVVVVDCQLRDNLGGVIGAMRSTGTISDSTDTTFAMAINGGYAVAPGDTTKSVAVWCASQFDQVSVAGVQLMVVNIQGIN